jgi:hypothetical protein
MNVQGKCAYKVDALNFKGREERGGKKRGLRGGKRMCGKIL